MNTIRINQWIDEHRYCPDCDHAVLQTYARWDGKHYQLACPTCGASTFTTTEYQLLLASAERRLTELGYTLGEVAGAVLKAHRDNAEEHEDVDRFGAPSECHALVNNGFERKLRTIVWGYGLTTTEYNGLLRQRCDGKQIFQLGLLV
jgi:hypothetical protein